MAVTEGTGPSSLPAIDKLTTDLTGQTTSPRPPAPSALPRPTPVPAKKAPTKTPVKRTTATRGTSATKPTAIPGLAGVNSAFDSRLMALIAAAPGRITITSGLRSTAQQQKLWEKYQNGTGNLAAKPGTSYHEKGLAYDIGFADDATRRWAHANASKFGLVFPIKSEAWHVEPVETRGQQLSAPAVAAGLKPITDVRSTPAGAVGSEGAVAGLGADQKIDPAAAIAEYGYIAELANSVPDIKKVLTQAIENGWTPARFTAAIQETAWWRTTTDKQRQVEVLKKTNPQEYRRQRQEMIDRFVITARNLGVEEGNQRIFILAERALSQGWDDDQIQRYLAADVKVKASGNTGMTATTVDSLKEQASQYGVPMSQQTLQMWTTQVLRGMVPAESFTSYLKEQAKSLFPGLSKAIDAGVTVEQYVEPYRQLAARTLERNPEEFRLDNPFMMKALYGQTAEGSRAQMSLAEFQNYLRGTDGYRGTREAQEMAASFTNTITDLFGATA